MTRPRISNSVAFDSQRDACEKAMFIYYAITVRQAQWGRSHMIAPPLSEGEKKGNR